MSDSHYNTGTKRHAGVRVRDTHGGAPLSYVSPSLPDAPSGVERDGNGGMIQPIDLGARIVQTGHFDLLAAAPQVNNNPLAPVDAEVVIDTEGIHILNGKLFLKDYGGSSVLGPAGFDGSWVEFVHSGVYNGGFNAGITNWIVDGVTGSGDLVAATTIVSSADTPADYLASLSAAIPYWIVSEYSSTDSSISAVVSSDSADGRYLAVERATGSGSPTAGGHMTFMQDVPVVQGREYELMWDYQVSGSEPGDTASIQWSYGWRDSEHGLVAADVAGSIYVTSIGVGNDPSGRHVWNIGTAPVLAKYARLYVKVTLPAGVSTPGILLQLFDVGLRPVSEVNKIVFPAFVSGDNVAPSIESDGLGLQVKVTEGPAAYGGVEVWNDNGLDGYPFLTLDRVAGAGGGISLGDGSAAPDTSLRRVSPGVLEISDGLRIGNGTLRGSGTSFPGSPSTNDRFFRTDRMIEYYYDGTRWLSTTLYSLDFEGFNGLTTSPGVSGRMPGWFSQYDLWLVHMFFSFHVVMTNSGVDYWTLTLEADNGSAGQTITSRTTAGLSANTWYRDTVAIGALLSSYGTIVGLMSTASKTASPGALYASYQLTYRLVG